MRFAIISDIHSNKEALNCVLQHISKRGIKEIICLGDVVGYGPNPIECVQSIMEVANICLKGNHDEAIIEGVYLFNRIAKGALEWTKTILEGSSAKEEIWEYLSDLPLMYTLDHYNFVHGSPLDPTSDYILARNIPVEQKKFEEIFSSFGNVLFCGHSHIPCVITESLNVFTLDQLGFKYKIGEEKAIVNVGSVGQSRDGDPRSCYVEVIDDFFFFHRVPYNYEAVCQQILDNENLHNALGERLLKGK